MKCKRILIILCITLLSVTNMTACGSVKVLNKGVTVASTKTHKSGEVPSNTASGIIEAHKNALIHEDDVLNTLEKIQKEQLSKPKHMGVLGS